MPKFKVGDIIVRNRTTSPRFKITAVGTAMYLFENVSDSKEDLNERSAEFVFTDRDFKVYIPSRSVRGWVNVYDANDGLKFGMIYYSLEAAEKVADLKTLRGRVEINFTDSESE